MSTVQLSVIIPARNEARLIEQTVQHALAACHHFAETANKDAAASGGKPSSWEVLVVDNASTDGTLDILCRYEERGELKVIRLDQLGAARARNAGRQHASGRVLVFIDADTMIPRESLGRIARHCKDRTLAAGITALGRFDGGLRARLWWAFWNQVRRLPLARAKAMPAFMFCTAATFDTFGPFDEEVAIGEEWPILAGLYRHRPNDLIYDRSMVARSSSRRMDYGRFGYTKTLAKYGWAILHHKGRVHYTDSIR